MARDIYTEILNPEKALTLLREFIDKYGIASAEDIENDNVIVNTPELLEALCEAVGYAEVEEDELDVDPDYPEEVED